jgi:hypothetical protein
MDDSVKDRPIDQNDDKSNQSKKRRGWRTRIALGSLILIIVIGYGLIFSAIDFWNNR